MAALSLAFMIGQTACVLVLAMQHPKYLKASVAAGFQAFSPVAAGFQAFTQQQHVLIFLGVGLLGCSILSGFLSFCCLGLLR